MFKESHVFQIIHISGAICGDKCASEFSSTGTCGCGKEIISASEGFYCCIPQNATCTENVGAQIECIEGRKLRFNESCEGQCPEPLNHGYEYTTIVTNCTYNSKRCSSKAVSKVCVPNVEDVKNFCPKVQSEKRKNKDLCPEAISRHSYKQCYE